MAARDDFRRALLEGDVRLLRRMWASARPHMPQPSNAYEGTVCLHVARTSMASIPLKLRAYSHRWLTDQGLPSKLPDHLKPKAEQLCPKITASAGFAWGSSSKILRPAAPYIHKAVGDRVEDIYANGDGDKPDLVRSEMIQTKDNTLKKLFSFREHISEALK